MVVLALFSATAHSQIQPLVLKANMQVLRCDPPDANYRFAGSSAPGQLFFPDEPVNVRLVFKKGADKGTVDCAVEIQEITTRDPERKIEGMEGFSDTAGHAPLIGLEGKPVLHPLKVTFDDKPETAFEVKDLPVELGNVAIALA